MDTIHIIGAGGIGCAIGHTLGLAGVPVVFVETSPEKIARGGESGVEIEGRVAVPARFIQFTDWQPPNEGVVLLCTKCPANQGVLARLPSSVQVVPVQNGVDPGLGSRVPRVEGIASFVSECRPERPCTRITRRGGLHLGIHGSPTPELNRLANELVEALRGGPFRVHRVVDILPFKYAKLLYNAAISPLAASAGLDNGELLRWPRLRRLFFALLRENQAILQHAGIALDRIGPLHPATVARILARPWLANLFSWAFYPSLRGTYCSMAGDLPRGPTEIDHYNGHLIDLAGTFPCPLNRAVRDLVRRIEAEQLTPHPDRLIPLFELQ